ncbi:MAG: hypothetical protein ACI8Y8_003776, partial [Planctomycetota bacterium]
PGTFARGARFRISGVPFAAYRAHGCRWLAVMAVLTVLFGVHATPLVHWCHASTDIFG